MTRNYWVDGFFADKLADPETAYKDVREAHEYVTRQLQNADLPQRIFNLKEERKRLAGIAWKLKRLSEGTAA